jgi:UDP-N-acetylmuramyl tripeptide synthase
VWTHLIPATLEGRALHNVQNAMFAAALAFSLGVKLDAIRQGLRTFDSTLLPGAGPHERLQRGTRSRCCSTTGTTRTRSA